MNNNKCRFCNNPLQYSFADLGMSPLSNSYLNQDSLQKMEPFYPLHAYVCDKCFLVQLSEFQSPEHIFSDYAYFSSYSESWLNHAKAYTDTMVKRFGFGAKSFVVEIASNDGYLLQYFKEKRVPILGIEPAQNVAAVAEKAGIPTISKFFGVNTAKELSEAGKNADLLLGNNVLAHVPDLNDFVKGLKILLKPQGVITLEFPHLLNLIEKKQFDTIYHEHFSYFSLITAQKIFLHHGLTIFDVEEFSTHGGSLRVYARHNEDNSKPVNKNVPELIDREEKKGFARLEYYRAFADKVMETKRQVLTFLINAKSQGKTIAGYGAPAKGNTLLNYCGIMNDFIDYTVDRNPHKQGLFLPGSHIPVNSPEKISETRPDYLLILPWNLKEEIMKQMHFVRDWGCKFVTLIPRVEIN